MPDNNAVDRVDAAILELFASEPRLGVLEASRRLLVARSTVQARLDKLASRGVLTGWGPDVDTSALGFPVTAFVTFDIAQAGHDDIGHSLAGIPEVLEVHRTTGSGDLLARVVADPTPFCNESSTSWSRPKASTTPRLSSPSRHRCRTGCSRSSSRTRTRSDGVTE